MVDISKPLKTIWLYGTLRKRCGVDKVQYHVSSVKEAIELLSQNYKEVLKPLANRPRLLCRVKGFNTEKELFEPTDEDDIHIYPCLTGGGGGNGLFKIIIGALMIASLFIPGAGEVAFAVAGVIGTTATAALAGLIVAVGAGLILGGAMELMGLVPKADNTTQNNTGYLGAQENTVAIGTPIAIIMGEILVYGQIISFNVEAVDIAATS